MSTQFCDVHSVMSTQFCDVHSVMSTQFCHVHMSDCPCPHNTPLYFKAIVYFSKQTFDRFLNNSLITCSYQKRISTCWV